MRSAFAVAFAFLAIVSVPFNNAFGDQGPGCAPCLIHDGGELSSFWWSGLSALEIVRPAFEIAQDGCITFTGHDGELGLAWIRKAGSCAPKAVVRITDAVLEDGPQPTTGWATVSFPWRQGYGAQFDPAADATAHPVYRGITNACRLVTIVTGCGGIAPGRVGLIGDGYGASIAMAVAALMPDRVQFVIAHQPIRLSKRLYSGVEDVAQAAELGRAAERVGRVLNADKFAPYVPAPTLVIAGDADPYCTLSEAQALHAGLRGAKTIWQLPGVGHCAPEELTGWEAAWTNWVATQGTPEDQLAATPGAAEIL